MSGEMERFMIAAVEGIENQSVEIIDYESVKRLNPEP
jgi:hypothetical protein